MTLIDMWVDAAPDESNDSRSAQPRDGQHADLSGAYSQLSESNEGIAAISAMARLLNEHDPRLTNARAELPRGSEDLAAAAAACARRAHDRVGDTDAGQEALNTYATWAATTTTAEVPAFMDVARSVYLAVATDPGVGVTQSRDSAELRL